MPIIEFLLRSALPTDADAIAYLHTMSWRSAYRGMLPEAYLDGPLAAEQRNLWQTRLAVEGTTVRQHIALACTADHQLLGFVCVLPDIEPAFGARLENLHVHPARKGSGIGHQLFEYARGWIAQACPGSAMHLWVLAENRAARAFYERRGGRAADSAVWKLPSGEGVPELRYCWDATPANAAGDGTANAPCTATKNSS